jgi:hypothetical protein
VGANASNASVRKQPKVDKIPTTSKKKKCIKTGIDNGSYFVLKSNCLKLNLLASSMEATSTIQESINIHQAAEGAIFDPLHPDSIKENVAVVIEDSTIASPSMEASSTNFKSNFVTFQSLETSSKVPKNWMWSFDKIKLMIYCISMDQLPNGNFNVKIVRFQNKQEVMYYVNGKIIPSSTTALSNHFTTIEDISQLLKDFNNRKICSGIPQERFRNVNFPSRLSGTLDSTAGVLRSKFCRTISEKKRVCVQCLYLKKYLSQRLSKMEVKIPISKEKKEKSKLAEKKLAKRA